MGESEDAYNKAEALFKEAVENPPWDKPVTEQLVELVEETFVSLEAKKLFRIGSYYIAPENLFTNEGLYTNKSPSADVPCQSNGDILPFTPGYGRHRGSVFAKRNEDGDLFIIYKILSKTKDTVKIQIDTSQLRSTARFSPYIVHCNREVFYNNLPDTKPKDYTVNWSVDRFEDFQDSDLIVPEVFNQCYLDKCDKIASDKRKIIEENKKAKSKRENAKAFINNQLEQIKEIAEAIYPGETNLILKKDCSSTFVRFDDNYQFGAFFCILLVRFPSFTIVNKENHTHSISDLYVAIPFKCTESEVGNTGIWVDTLQTASSNIYGCRGTMTTSEHKSGYRHSHLGSAKSTYNKFSKFCLGGGSSIAMSLAELSNNFSVDRFELFLYELSAYVKYESIEGGPYIRMANIKNLGNTNSHSSLDCTKEYQQLFRQISLNNTDSSKQEIVLPIEYDHLKNQYVLNTNNETFLQELGKLTVLPFVKDVNGTLIPFSTANISYTKEMVDSLSHNMLKIEGRIIKFKIKDHETEDSIEQVLYPSPTLTEVVKEKLEQEINLFYTLKQTYELS
tara:strand:+ start:125 stop:1813 length:1689 start_codon:yes stop_codon:yes gene_type:complete